MEGLRLRTYLVKQQSVDKDAVFMPGHLPREEREQYPNLSGLENEKMHVNLTINNSHDNHKSDKSKYL